MAELINVQPAELRRAAETHRLAAEQLSEVPRSHDEIMASLESLGPVFAELRDAGRELLEHRRSCYLQQAAAHSDLADTLQQAADAWEHHESSAAQRIQRL